MKESTQESLDALTRGINAELAAYVFYKRAMIKIANPELSSLLGTLANEEKDHYWTLEAEYDSLVRSEKWVTYNDIMRKSGLPDVPEEMAQAHKARFEKLDKTKDPHQILGIAIGLEEEARDFYKSQVEKVKDPVAIDVYAFLAKFEQGHVNILTAWKNKF